MHTIKVILGGLALLGILFAARAWLTPRVSGGTLFLFFTLVWFCLSVINLWNGMHRAGYSLREELPFFLLVFGVPVIAALIAWKR